MRSERSTLEPFEQFKSANFEKVRKNFFKDKTSTQIVYVPMGPSQQELLGRLQTKKFLVKIEDSKKMPGIGCQESVQYQRKTNKKFERGLYILSK